MKLAVDIGNTRTKAALFEEERLLEAWENLPSDEIETLCTRHGVTRIVLSNVASPEREPKFPCGIDIHRLSSSSRLPIVLDYDTPETLGADRIADAVGAWTLYPGTPLVVIDAGTCITVDYVDRTGIYRGGAIVPGINMQLQALHHFTNRLPYEPRPVSQPSTIGRNTKESIHAGTVGSLLTTLQAWVAQARTAQADTRVVVTGGDASYLTNQISLGLHDPHLQLRGLNAILDIN